MNASFVELPNALMAHLIGQYGDPQKIDHLGGHTRALVRCVWFEQKSLVIKATSNDREVSFYGTIAPVLRKEGVPIPDLEWIHQEAEHSWMLVLEHIPLKLPRDRWLADPEILQALFRLHTYSGRQQTDSVFHPVWSDEMTAGAASYFPEPIKEKLQHLLDQMRIKAVHLLEPLCWISGDPNPTNWGLRLNDQAILFDWERFGRGHPALDLAITIPGLGREADFHRVAAEYLKGRLGDNEGVMQLSRDIALAKTWTVVEFLHEVRSGETRDGIELDWLLSSLPQWLIHVGGIVGLSSAADR